MKLLFIVGATPPIPCGVGDQVYKLSKYISEKFEAEVILFTYFNLKLESSKKFKVYTFFNSKLRFYLKLIYILIKERPNAVHFSYPNRGFTFSYPFGMILFLKIFVKRTIVTFHEDIKSENRLNRFLIKKLPDQIVIVREELAEKIGLKRYITITNFSSIPVSAISEGERNEINIKIAKGKLLCGHFGFVAPQRGVDQLLDILDAEKYHLIIIGSLLNDEYSQLLQKKIWKRKWLGNVTITGYISDYLVADLLYACDLVILPFKNGAHEANTSTKAVSLQGTYLVTTSFDRYGYDSKRNTYFVQPDNPDQLRGALSMEIRKFPKGEVHDDSIDIISDKYYKLLT